MIRMREKSEDRPNGKSLRHRLGAVFRQWLQTRMILSRFFRYHLNRADCTFIIAAAILLFLLQVEPLLWARLDLPTGNISAPDSKTKDDPVKDLIFKNPLEGFWISPFEGLTVEQTRGFWLIFLLVYLVNAWLLDRWLSRTSGDDAGVHPAVLTFRRFVLGIPWLGLGVFPAWRILLDVRPSWVFRKEPTSDLKLDSSQQRKAGFHVPHLLRAVLTKVGDSTLFLAIWLVPVNMMALRAGLAWLNVPERTSLAVLLLLSFAIAGLRFLGFACLLSTVILRSREAQLPFWKWIFFGLSCFLWLLPMPLPMLSFLMVLQLEKTRIKTILYKIHESNPYPQKLREAAGLGSKSLPWLLRGLIADFESSEDSVTRYKILKFYRAKTFLLFIDTASFIMFLMWLEKNYLKSMWLQLVVGIPAILLIGVVAIGGAVGLLARTYSFLTRAFQPVERNYEQDHYPMMRYFMLTSLAFFSGFMIIDSRKDPQAIATAFLHTGTIAFLFSILYLLPAVGRYLFANSDRDFGLFLWPVAFQVIAQIGYVTQDDPKAAEALSQFLKVLVTLTPLWSLLLFAWRGSWLVRPFKWSDVFNDRLPRRVRWSLRLLLVTALLPLMGLAIPYWIRLRRWLEVQFNQLNIPTQ